MKRRSFLASLAALLALPKLVKPEPEPFLMVWDDTTGAILHQSGNLESNQLNESFNVHFQQMVDMDIRRPSARGKILQLW